MPKRPTDRQIKTRMTSSNVREVFAPQCNTCSQNKGSEYCIALKTAIPPDFFWAAEKCPDYDHRSGMRRPPIQGGPMPGGED